MLAAVGELDASVVAPAIANAIFAAVVGSINQLPATGASGRIVDDEARQRPAVRTSRTERWFTREPPRSTDPSRSTDKLEPQVAKASSPPPVNQGSALFDHTDILNAMRAIDRGAPNHQIGCRQDFRPPWRAAMFPITSRVTCVAAQSLEAARFRSFALGQGR
jgi:hypothetical protein